MLRFCYIALISYWTVLIAELIGDRSLYMITSFALRFQLRVILYSMFIAFSLRMFLAVWLGEFLLRVSGSYTAIITTVIFFASAAFLCFRSQREKIPHAFRGNDNKRRANTFVPFVSLLFCEWIDAGQISAAALTSHFQLPVAIWLGGTLALLSKGIIALLVGTAVRQKIPEKLLRTVAATSLSILGMISLIGLFTKR